MIYYLVDETNEEEMSREKKLPVLVHGYIDKTTIK